VIAHIVLFKPRDSLGTEQRRAILDGVLAGVKRCPTVRACRIGRRVLHGLPGYEQAMREDYQYVLILEFETVQGLTDYLAHPEHARLAACFSTASAAALAYDYELVPLEAALLHAWNME